MRTTLELTARIPYITCGAMGQFVEESAEGRVPAGLLSLRVQAEELAKKLVVSALILYTIVPLISAL